MQTERLHQTQPARVSGTACGRGEVGEDVYLTTRSGEKNERDMTSKDPDGAKVGTRLERGRGQVPLIGEGPTGSQPIQARKGARPACCTRSG